MLILLLALSARVAAASTIEDDANDPDLRALDRDADGDAEADALADSASSPDAVDQPSWAQLSAWGVGSEEVREMRDRRHGSRLGRLDLSIVWQRTLAEPTIAMPTVRDEVWLLGTWRL